MWQCRPQQPNIYWSHWRAQSSRGYQTQICHYQQAVCWHPQTNITWPAILQSDFSVQEMRQHSWIHVLQRKVSKQKDNLQATYSRMLLYTVCWNVGIWTGPPREAGGRGKLCNCKYSETQNTWTSHRRRTTQKLPAETATDKCVHSYPVPPLVFCCLDTLDTASKHVHWSAAWERSISHWALAESGMSVGELKPFSEGARGTHRASPPQEPSTMVKICTLGCPEHNLTCSPDSHWDALELQTFAQGVPSCLHPGADWVQVTNASFESLVHYCFVI